MNKRIVLILLMFASVAYTAIIYSADQSHKHGSLSFLIRILSDFGIYFLVSIFISLIISLLPFKNQKFTTKLKFVIPIVLLIIISVFSTMLFFHKSIDYASIKISSNLDCTSIKQGEFVAQGFLIKRENNIQTQIYSTSRMDKFNIVWVSECEYELLGINNTEGNFKAKIFEINNDGHKLYFASLNSNNAQIVELTNK